MEDVNISKYRAQVVRAGSTPASPGFVVSEGQNPVDPSGSGQNHLPVTIATAATGLSITDAQVLGGAGTVGQYIRGDGSLADFPATTGGGSSVSYYLNGSVSQGTIGGVAYRELNRTPIFGAGTDISINADGYIASFITDALDPNKLLIPAGNWNFETYFSASSSGGSPSFYVELYKYNGTTFTLIASSSTAPELIAFGTNLNPYYSTLAVPETVLALTDRLAVRFYVSHSGRTITLHTENGHLCQVITTFTTGLTALNGLTNQVQFFAVGTSGTDFAISSASDTHTFNLPTATSTIRGALSSADWTTFNNKENAITAGTTAQYFRGDKTFQTLNTAAVPELTNLYYTEARVNANTNVAANTAARHNAVTLGTANGLSLSTQVLSLGLASAGVTGALSGTDWTTFNGKQNALTNPVTGTGTTNYLPKFTGSTTIGNSNIQDSGTLVSVGVAATFSTSASINTTNAYGKFQTKVATDANFYLTSYSAGEVGVQFTNDANSLQCKAQFYASQFAFTTGNLLVGTTTDAGFKLDVNGTGRFNGTMSLENDGTYGSTYKTLGFTGNSNGSHRIFAGTADDMYFAAATARGFQFRPNGSTTTTFTIANTGAATFSSNLSIGNESNIYGGLTGLFAIQSGNSSYYSFDQELGIVGNAYFNSGWKYKTSNRASRYTANVGTHSFEYATSGTANGSLSWSQGLFISNSGNVGIGTANATGQSADNRVIQIYGAGVGNRAQIHFVNSDSGESTTDGSFIGIDFSRELYIINRENAATIFENNGSERMRITSGGNVLVGTTTDSGHKMQVYSSGTTRVRIDGGGNNSGVLLAESGTNQWSLASVGGTLLFYNEPTGATRININSIGEVYIGCSSDPNATTNGIGLYPNGEIDISRSSGSTAVMNRNTTNGVIIDFRYNNTPVGSISTNSNSLPSDRNFKKDISNISIGLNLINKLRPVHYRHKMDEDNEALSNGIIAQELEQALLDCGIEKNTLLMLQHKPNDKENESQYWVDYTKMIPILIKSIQELNEKIK